MPFVLFSDSRAISGIPSARVGRTEIYLNNTAILLFEALASDARKVELYWNAETQQIGLKPAKSGRAIRHNGGICAQGFINEYLPQRGVYEVEAQDDMLILSLRVAQVVNA